MKLFLDDKRDPPDGTWIVARTADAAIDLLKTGRVVLASLDHDLGHCESCIRCLGYAKSPCACRCHLTGYFVVCWMETQDIWPLGGVRVHSANPVGAAKMRQAIERAYSK